MTDRCIITEELYSFSPYDDDKPLAQLIDELTAVLYSVPEEDRDNVLFVVDRGYYDSPDSYCVKYTRQETDKEVEARIAQARRYEQDAASREHALYERLKNKYG